MSTILGVKFTQYGQTYYFDSGAFVVNKGQYVLVKTDQGLGLGSVADVREEPPPDAGAVKPIYRLVNDEDMVVKEENDALAESAKRYCRKCIEERKLDMKLVEVEVFFDRTKMVFFFTAPGRIDFRELVKDLVREYRTRIELRQIGVRHETQMLGAVGNCGQLCCCRRFMRKFHPVTIKMAKEQNLFLNPTKISGICGRLLCCLGFEQANYEDFHKQCPKIGKRFNTTLGRVRVARSNFFRETITLHLEGGGEEEVPVSEWKDIYLEGGQVPRPRTEQEQDNRRQDSSARNDQPGRKHPAEEGGGNSSSGRKPAGEPSPPATDSVSGDETVVTTDFQERDVEGGGNVFGLAPAMDQEKDGGEPSRPRPGAKKENSSGKKAKPGRRRKPGARRKGPKKDSRKQSRQDRKGEHMPSDSVGNDRNSSSS